MTNISWALLREDILLLRALHDVPAEQGFYIDLGANNPNEESVTKLLYDKGWKGINVEPSPFWHQRLCAERKRDINIHAAASASSGRLTLYDHPEGGLGTSSRSFADRHETHFGISMQAVEVDTVTLVSLCEAYAPRDIHLLKIDVEGHEEEALRGMDFSRFRPWILCIEATEPMRPDVPSFDAWEPLVTGAGYQFALFDGSNRWYVADEHPERLPLLSVPVDDYISWSFVRHIKILENRIRELELALGNK